MTRAIMLLVLVAGAFPLPGAALASEEDLVTIESECGKRLKMPPGGCTCMRDKAGELTDGQQAFVAAVVSKDKQAQASIMQNLTVGELTEAGMFMTQAPGQCAKGE
jgi:hypothetical protein